jgi:hypothetical protein
VLRDNKDRHDKVSFNLIIFSYLYEKLNFSKHVTQLNLTNFINAIVRGWFLNRVQVENFARSKLEVNKFIPIKFATRLDLRTALWLFTTLQLICHLYTAKRDMFFSESQVSELQIAELHISEPTYCRTDKLPYRPIVDHSTKCRTYWAVLFRVKHPLYIGTVFIEVRCQF